MFAWILRKFFKSFVITNDSGDPYLRRFYIISTRWFKVYVHEIIRSDDDRCLHDHPWPFTSIILKGSYVETNPGYTVRCRRFAVVRHKAADAHRLDIPAGQTTWTLVIVGRKERDWGFVTPQGWVHNEQWLDFKFGKGNWVKEPGME